MSIKDVIDLIAELWPMVAALGAFVALFAKLHHRVGVLEEKMRSAFDLINNKGK